MTPIRMLAAAAALAGAAAVTGCSPQANAVGGTVAGIEMVSLINTDKTIIDHIASLGPMDCSSVRASVGGVWCVEDSSLVGMPQVPQPTFCYRTLAEVSCYDRPSPHPGDTLVGIILPKMAAVRPVQALAAEPAAGVVAVKDVPGVVAVPPPAPVVTTPVAPVAPVSAAPVAPATAAPMASAPATATPLIPMR
ncbi:hypothetical protein [Caenispirillum bisanense]|uniref:Lipoprotein n=1 Tax=Caenispirillum bisanense TaxID=414052 RepID=A0A286GLG8_9PROT|nr:hypothetical protein [Caenispirillum bisanense]SOD96358.1 hypothetical protein SAMN05421508_105285 [Caenispirillum bisanense]